MSATPIGSPENPLESVGGDWVLLRRIEAYEKQGALAQIVGVDEGTLSAWKHNKGAMKIAPLKALLRELNLKLVDADAKCVKPSTFHELTQLAARALRDQPQLLWEDE